MVSHFSANLKKQTFLFPSIFLWGKLVLWTGWGLRNMQIICLMASRSTWTLWVGSWPKNPRMLPKGINRAEVEAVTRWMNRQSTEGPIYARQRKGCRFSPYMRQAFSSAFPLPRIVTATFQSKTTKDASYTFLSFIICCLRMLKANNY